MPRGDRTGPWGDGPMTGRRAGYCAGFDRPGYSGQGGFGRGRGGGMGRGPGRGYGRGMGYGRPAYREPDRFIPVYREPSPEDEKAYLENIMKDLEAEMKQIKERINQLAEKD